MISGNAGPVANFHRSIGSALYGAPRRITVASARNGRPMSGATAWRPDDPAWLAALGQAAGAIGSDEFTARLLQLVRRADPP